MAVPSDPRFSASNPVAPAAAVFVEGESDRIAVATLAARLGLDLSGTEVMSTGGSSAFKKFMSDAVRMAGGDIPLYGLCDEAETADAIEAITASGLGTPVDDGDLAAHGFYVCRRDLEDELIRAVGPDSVVTVIRDEGDWPSLDRLRRQPAWRDEPLLEQLRRFMSSQSGRKARYARLLIESMDLTHAPTPLLGLVSDIAGQTVENNLS